MPQGAPVAVVSAGEAERIEEPAVLVTAARTPARGQRGLAEPVEIRHADGLNL